MFFFWFSQFSPLQTSLAPSETISFYFLDSIGQENATSPFDHYEGIQRQTSVIVQPGVLDTDRRESAESLLSIHSSPTGVQS